MNRSSRIGLALGALAACGGPSDGGAGGDDAPATPATLATFCGRLTAVEAAPDRPRLPGALVLTAAEGPGAPLELRIEDARYFRAVELVTNRVMDTLIGEPDVGGLGLPQVCFGEVDILRRGDRATLTGADTLRAIEGGPVSADVAMADFLGFLFPECPAEDATHHYLTLPISYARPELGTFRLYYELSTGFDPAKKTFFIMNDPQSPGTALGYADTFVQGGYTPEGANAISFEVRGHPCSPIDVRAADGAVDWERAFYAFNMDNMVEDIERIRAAALGPGGKLLLAGESGHAFTALQYMAKYPANVEKALLVSLAKNLETSSAAGRAYATQFLADNGLIETVERLVNEGVVDRGQLLHTMQRDFYQQPELVVQMLRGLEASDPTLYQQRARAAGDVYFAVANYQHHQPNLAVYFYHLGLRPVDAPLDIFFRDARLVEPLAELGRQQRISAAPATAAGLDRIEAETVIVAGTLDQVVPIATSEVIYREMPGSRFVVFRAAHALLDQPECVMALRQNLDRGWEALEGVFKSAACPGFDHVSE